MGSGFLACSSRVYGGVRYRSVEDGLLRKVKGSNVKNKVFNFAAVALAGATVAASSAAQAVDLTGVDLTTGITDGQELILAAIVLLVGFVMLRKVFGK